jgi:hypothetical protein
MRLAELHVRQLQAYWNVGSVLAVMNLHSRNLRRMTVAKQTERIIFFNIEDNEK